MQIVAEQEVLVPKMKFAMRCTSSKKFATQATSNVGGNNESCKEHPNEICEC